MIACKAITLLIGGTLVSHIVHAGEDIVTPPSGGPQYDRTGDVSSEKEQQTPSSGFGIAGAPREGATAWGRSGPMAQNDRVRTGYRVNWYDKKDKVQQARVIYSKAHDLYHKVITPLIQQHREHLRATAAKLSDQLKKLPINKGEIASVQAILPEVVKRLSEEAAKQTEEKKEAFVSPTVPQAQQRLDELTRALDALEKLVGSFSGALGTLEGLAAQVAQQDGHAWKTYGAIDMALDQQAVDLSLENLHLIAQYMEEVEAYVQRAVGKFNGEVESAFAIQAGKVQEQLKRARTERIPVTMAEARPPRPPEPAAQKSTKGSGWLGWLAGPFMQAWDWLKGLFISCEVMKK